MGNARVYENTLNVFKKFLDNKDIEFKSLNYKKIKDFEESKKVYSDVEEIIYFRDILFPLGDIINRNYDLLKPGYVEEWWESELKKIIGHDIKGKVVNK